MKKRLRKKKHLGEFKEEGFTILAKVHSVETDEELNKFLDGFIDFVESRGCGIGGVVGSDIKAFYSKLGRGTCTEEDREAINKYLTDHPLVTWFRVGKLVDAWYGDDFDDAEES